ncbi:MAG: cation-translocating P-type ATPase [Gammaproteobacteria bacterium]
MLINIIHDEVPGRLRFAASALYRARHLVRRVELALLELEPVVSVTGNALTARVLVMYRPTQELASICDAIDQALSDILPQALDVKTNTHVSRVASVSTAHGHKSTRHKPVVSSDSSSHWHALKLDDVIHQLCVNPVSGLSRQEAGLRLQQYGPNVFGRYSQRSDLRIFIEQFKSLPVAMLAVSAAIAVATGGRIDAAVIVGVVITNALIGYGTERQAEHTIASLGSMAPTHTCVIRDGKQHIIDVTDVVPGDLAKLSPGTQIAGDARLLSARRLTVDESALTGESLPVSKLADAHHDLDTPLSERRNMLHMGTVVTGGNGRAIVVQTGSQTELGQIQSLVDTTQPPETPMEKQLGRLSTQLGILSGVVCAGIFGIGLLRGQPMLQMLNSAVSLAVAAVPEGLPAVATTTLAVGIKDMKQHHVTVRQIEAVETLGSVQVLCLDKTGTLTRNHMTVVEAETIGHRFKVEENRFLYQGAQVETSICAELQSLLEMITLCNEASLEDNKLSGSPTEIALLELSRANYIDIAGLHKRYHLVEIRERAENRPLMSSIHVDGDDGLLLAVKGRPSEILERCTEKMLNGQLYPLTDKDHQLILEANERMATDALRVLGVAYRRIQKSAQRNADKLVWLGMVGMHDPLRPGMGELIELNHRAGIRTVMITGDQSATAYAIARQLGLANGQALQILDSSQLDKMPPDLLTSLVSRVDVFSRVSPAHKLRIVLALQQAGKVVAMTGDGINDGPALKAADIGIAMGASGTDIARSVADVVIDDDDLHTIAVAVRQGRTIYANIRKTIHYLLSTNFSEIEVMLVGISTGLGAPLNPMQLLWINLITDIFPGLALAFEPASYDVMERDPRPADAPIITNQRLGIMAVESGLISAGAMAAYLYGQASDGHARGSTLAFHTLTFAQLLHAIASRSQRHSIFDTPRLPRNPWFERALLGTALGQLSTLFLPTLRRMLGTSPVRPVDGLVIIAGSILPLLGNEIFKVLRRPERHIIRQNTSGSGGNSDDG